MLLDVKRFLDTAAMYAFIHVAEDIVLNRNLDEKMKIKQLGIFESDFWTCLKQGNIAFPLCSIGLVKMK